MVAKKFLEHSLKQSLVPGLIFLGTWIALAILYSGIGESLFIKIPFFLAIPFLAIVLFRKSHANVENNNPTWSYFYSGVFSVVLTGLYVLVGLIVVVNFSFLINGSH